jgi:predicted MFS family arabinose efflux permease
MAATAAVTLLFTATPFLITPISERYGVSLGMAGAISIAQVGAFAVANFLLPRFVRPSGTILRVAAISLVVFNALSVFPDYFSVLVALRVGAGAAGGTMTWLAWSNAMKRRKSMSSIAATGPMTAFLAAPLLALIAGQGSGAVYATLAVAAIPAAIFLAPLSGKKRVRGVISGSRSNRVLLAALFGMTFFGSSLYLNQTIVAREIHGLSAFAASIGFSLNALGGFLGARLSMRHRYPGWFMASIGLASLTTVFGPTLLFYPAMAWWGFAFWMGVPGVLQMLVDRSLEPSERAGDGQGVMAVGRAFGPAMGGAFIDIGTIAGLAITSALGIMASGLSVVGVKQGREHLPPSDPRTIDQRDQE